MIRIDSTKLNNWNEIKKDQCEYLKLAVEKELSNLYIKNNSYIRSRKIRKSKKYHTYYKLNNSEREEIENIFGGVFTVKNQKSKFVVSDDKKIEKLVVGKLEEVISIFEKNIINKNVINRIFNYEKFCNNNGWNRHRLISKLGIKVCPYCNRQYITNYEDLKGNKEKTTADLDHFYSKSLYPYLALSLYNLIPSCQICNSRFKLDKDFRKYPHIYPYEEGFGDNAKFKTRGNTVEYLLGNTLDFDIYLDVFESKYKNKIENSIKTFHLNELYKVHTDYVQEIIKKIIIYNDSKLNEILLDFPELFSSKNEMLRTIFGNYIVNEELGKRPLSKLTKDICEELGLNLKNV
ncbi:hypothetical protein ACJDT4_09310 [Clostridium neuense]|uniref:HNH nuclease domain-containing protein n=1 Tax=Clostridium neuense TaxID=1728934 RepID=A0ABW8TEH3_9CLOT